MANTFTQLYVHFVFGVRHRRAHIPREKREELHRYITGLVTNRKCHVLAINSEPDHIHIFVSMGPTITPSDLMKDVKSISSKWINENGWTERTFRWQTGYAAVSHSQSQIGDVVRYIDNQEEHHKKRDWKEEYVEILKRFNIPYDARYLFDPDEDE